MDANQEIINKALKDAQDVMSKWIVPDSEISDAQAMDELVGILDNVTLFRAQKALAEAK